MSISVVIATFNRAELLRSTLEQLRRQDYEPGDEVVVVDNGSTDGTARVIAEMTTAFPVPLQRVSEPTPGKTAALEAGLASCHGDLLALTDDDVVVADDWIVTIRRLFEDPDLALVGGRVDPLWQRPAPRWLRVEARGGYGQMGAPLALLHYGDAGDLGERTAVGANLAVRQAALLALGGFDPDLGRHRGTLLCGEDHDLCRRAVAAGYRCQYRPELRVRHFVPAERMRLRYYLRWFFWSGVTHALLEGRGDAGAAIPLRYLIRQLVTAPMLAIVRAMSGRLPEAAAEAAEAAFSLGFLVRRVRTASPIGPGAARAPVNDRPRAAGTWSIR
jgi:glucosyl-dolichyl phosphate glucuronosyltransferase